MRVWHGNYLAQSCHFSPETFKTFRAAAQNPPVIHAGRTPAHALLTPN